MTPNCQVAGVEQVLQSLGLRPEVILDPSGMLNPVHLGEENAAIVISLGERIDQGLRPARELAKLEQRLPPALFQQFGITEDANSSNDQQIELSTHNKPWSRRNAKLVTRFSPDYLETGIRSQRKGVSWRGLGRYSDRTIG